MGVIRTIGVVLHPQRDCLPVLEMIVKWAHARGTDVLGLTDEVDRVGGLVTAVSPADLSARSDLVVSLGGDGTMLRALRMVVEHRPPVLGVNLGRLGFLAEVDVPELDQALCAIDEHRFTVENRSAIRGRIGDRTAVAFNDIVLARVPGRGMPAIELNVEGHPFVRYSADAVVVATPTGSTAYNFAAGGPIVSPRAEGLLVTPASPHSAFNRALFLSTGEKLALEILPSSGDVAMEADGVLIGHVKAGDILRIEVLPAAAKVVRLGLTTFYQRTQRKFRLTGSAEADGAP
jgi:NAD+ kinase